MKTRRSIRYAVIIALLAGAGVAAAIFGRGFVLRSRATTTVLTEAVTRRDIAVTIEATGTVEPVDLVEVKSKASGQILRMPVEAGSVVRAGDLLAQIDTVDVANQYEQAAAAQRAAQARVDVSGAQLRRAQDLFAKQVITAVEMESASLDFANADAQLVKARTDLDTARQRRADATVRAPLSGTILAQLVSTGQVISSATSSVSGGTTLLNMADLSRIRLRALVSETDIGSVHSGQTATVSVDAFPQHPFQGAVEKVEPQAVVQQSVTMFPVLITISNEEGLLLPGMNGEVTMTVEQRHDVLAVPLDAVRTVKELSTVARNLGMVPDSVTARISRQRETLSGHRSGEPRATGRRGRAAWTSGEHRASSGPGAPEPGEPPPPEGPEEPATPGQANISPAQGNRTSGGSRNAVAEATTGTNGAAKTQVVFIRDAQGLEPRIVRLGISDFDYAEVLSGIDEGDEVVLLNVAELQAKRTQDQSMLRERIGSTMPGASTSSRTRSTGR